MKEKLDAWTVDTVDLTARVAAAIGAMPLSPEGELIGELRALRREVAELREVAALLGDEVARLRLGGISRRIVPFGGSESAARLS